MNPNNTPISFCVAEKTPDNAVECEGALIREGWGLQGRQPDKRTNRQEAREEGSSCRCGKGSG